MAYREETEALHARVGQLEADNAALRRENAELVAGTTPSIEGGARRWLGGPVKVEHQRTFAGELPPEARERLVEILRERFGAVGEITVLGSTLTWRMGPPSAQRAIELTVSARDGETRLRLVERLGNLAGGLFGGIVGGVGGGGLGFVIPLGIFVGPAIAVALTPLWIGLVYGIVRSIYGGVARGREAELRSVARQLEQAIERALASAPPRVRVEAPAAEPPRVEEDAPEHEAGARESRAHPR